MLVIALLGVNLFGLLLSVTMLPALGSYVTLVLLLVLGGFTFSALLLTQIMAGDDGTPDMHAVADAIREGSEGFLRVQYGAVVRVSAVIAAVLFGVYLLREPSGEVQVGRVALAGLTMLAFLLGALCSALAGYIGVWAAVRANVRVAGAANQGSFPGALLMAMRAGTFSSLVSTAMCILGMSVLYTIMYTMLSRFGDVNPHQLPLIMVGYGFGASFVALMMQMGGGIYTKAADVGADMVGKIEASIPEDDPRNPAVIADLVGDNVGDCAGSMADVFESVAAEILGTMILAATLAKEAQFDSATTDAFIYFPLVIHAFDLVGASLGLLSVGAADAPGQDSLSIMRRGYHICLAVSSVFFVLASRIMLYTELAPDAWWHFALCGLVGLTMAYLLQLVTTYYTDYQYAPVRRIAQASTTGHGTNIIAGLAVGMESTAIPAIIIVVGLFTSFQLGATSGLPSAYAGVFGTATATTGLLSTACYVLATNNFGAIVDNAGGIAEMGGCPEHVRTITDALDAVGNVTKASTKGFAVGASALACFVLFKALLDEIKVYSKVPFLGVDISRV
jgi:H(+)-translocating pyrophosphatase